MFYTIYKTTNTLNDKYYIGKHKTLDPNDDYLGSGKVLKCAITKYRRENFKKEVLHIFDNEADMNAKEKELVVLAEDSYNLKHGGDGGWDYINQTIMTSQMRSAAGKIGGAKSRDSKKPWQTGEWQRKRFDYTNILSKLHQSNVGRKHSEETRKLMSDRSVGKQTGTKNSQYGTIWITNGSSNKKIKKEELDNWVQLGYTRGRIA